MEAGSSRLERMSCFKERHVVESGCSRVRTISGLEVEKRMTRSSGVSTGAAMIAAHGCLDRRSVACDVLSLEHGASSFLIHTLHIGSRGADSAIGVHV